MARLHGKTALITGGTSGIGLATARLFPAGRRGTVEEIAGAVLFLVSDESRFTVGSDFVIDGGMSNI